MKAIQIIPVENLPLIAKGDRLGELIVNAAEKQGTPIQERDIVVITHKIVSKTEGNIVNLDSVSPSEQAKEIAQAREDSWLKALFRRFISNLMRTDFEIVLSDGTRVGAFHRKFTVADKYLLDLTGDPTRRLDRRIALGLAILLDTAESR